MIVVPLTMPATIVPAAIRFAMTVPTAMIALALKVCATQAVPDQVQKPVTTPDDVWSQIELTGGVPVGWPA